jgi:20S proteasome alpha/beta subunit
MLFQRRIRISFGVAFVKGFIYNVTQAELGRNSPNYREFQGFRGEFESCTKLPRKLLDFSPKKVQTPFWPKQKNKPLFERPKWPMSQIIGIICKDSIVIASETQYTVSGDTKLTTAKKLSIVKFKNGDVIVGEAGDVSSSARAVQYLNEITSGKEITSENCVAEYAEEAVRRVRQDLLDSYQKRDYTVSEQDEIFRSKYFALIVAYYFNPTRTPIHINPQDAIPRLYTINMLSPFAQKEHPFAVIGAADTVATFVLKKFDCHELSWRKGASLVMDVLEQIKVDNIYCGGEIQFGCINPNIGILPTAAVGENWSGLVPRVVQKLKVLRDKMTGQYKNGLEEIMAEIHRENYENFKKKFIASDAERLKAFEQKYPESTLAIGEEAVRKSAEKWNKEHPEQQIPIEEWLVWSKAQKPANPLAYLDGLK